MATKITCNKKVGCKVTDFCTDVIVALNDFFCSAVNSIKYNNLKKCGKIIFII